MHPRSLLAFVSLLLACAATDARSQSATSAAQPFPGVAWGVSADSVIRVLGEPADRSTTRAGLHELDYPAERKGWTGTRYVLVHPTLGTVISGYAMRLRAEDDCPRQVRSWVEEIVRDYPRFEWDSTPSAEAVCDSSLRPSGVTGQDPESGTRIGLRRNRSRDSLVADAISPAGFEWVGTTR